MSTFTYEIAGTAAGGQTWETSGEVSIATPGDFDAALDEAQRQSFLQLTGGKAVFGQPGVGCRGPYGITKLVLKEKPDG